MGKNGSGGILMLGLLAGAIAMAFRKRNDVVESTPTRVLPPTPTTETPVVLQPGTVTEVNIVWK